MAEVQAHLYRTAERHFKVTTLAHGLERLLRDRTLERGVNDRGNYEYVVAAD